MSELVKIAGPTGAALEVYDLTKTTQTANATRRNLAEAEKVLSERLGK